MKDELEDKFQKFIVELYENFRRYPESFKEWKTWRDPCFWAWAKAFRERMSMSQELTSENGITDDPEILERKSLEQVYGKKR